MPKDQLIDKISHEVNGRFNTIFKYKTTTGKVYYMLAAGRSSHKYATLAAAKKAIDRGTMRSKPKKKKRY